jgi:uncharacterized damage-inducible protein DinB
MIHSLKEFFITWEHESASTLKVFRNLTDESLSTQVYEGGRTLGRLANHIIETLSELPSKLDLGITEKHPQFDTASSLVEAYEKDSTALITAIKSKWTDDSLNEKHNMYGEEWKNNLSLWVLITHQIHHRGQMTVLMRQAGLKVPGIYGPSKEEWEAIGMAALA